MRGEGVLTPNQGLVDFLAKDKFDQESGMPECPHRGVMDDIYIARCLRKTYPFLGQYLFLYASTYSLHVDGDVNLPRPWG